MRWLPYLLGLLLLAAPIPLLAAAANCVPDSGCPKDWGPADCCEEPKCEFWEALIIAKARSRIAQREHEAMFELTPLTFRLRDLVEYRNRVGDALRKFSQEVRRCPQPSPIGEPPIFSVMPSDDCRIMTYVGPGQFAELSLQQNLNQTSACREVVEARHAAAEARSSGGTCFLEQNDPGQLGDRISEWLNESRKEETKLEEQLQHYFRVCTVGADPYIARLKFEAIEKWLSEALANSPPAKPAKRASKSGRRR